MLFQSTRKTEIQVGNGPELFTKYWPRTFRDLSNGHSFRACNITKKLEKQPENNTSRGQKLIKQVGANRK